ncbi:cytochrome P450 [Mycena olivaceomarginata]|nr:cytochrome P450 [Mycena olivaceomarginata]
MGRCPRIVQPIALLMFVEGPFTFMGLAWSYAVFLGSLSLSIAAYRLSPFHPLAQYPGPAIGKVTKLWGFWKTLQGYKYIITRSCTTHMGRPNEISVIDLPAVCQILNFGGLQKGRCITPPSIVCMSGEAHTKKRRVWNRAMTSSSLRDYEPLVAKRASQMVSRLRDQHGPVDLGNWLNFFAFDLMGDLAFGGGFENLRDGEDTGGLGERIRGFVKASYLSGQLPWIIKHVAPISADFNDFGQRLAMQRMKNGAVGTMDLWYHLADEAGSAADGIVAIIAASDTVASTMCSLVWFLLSNPEYYRRVQQELDSVFVDGDDPFEVSKHQELHFLSACMHETLRLHPPIPSNGTRQVHLHQPGRNIAGRFIPSGTSVYTPAYSLHRNPHYFFPHPDKFDPERWLPDSKFEKHDTSAFAPFSLGPANCVGQKFGKREILMASSILFKSFDLQFADGFDSDAWPKSMRDFFVFTRGPFLVNLTPRHRN